MESERTIRSEAEFSGIGLHSGERVTLTVKPAPPGSGITFVRTDLNPPVSIPARIDFVTDGDSATTLGREGVEVGTVEHFLAAAYGLEIDNLEVWVPGPEIPAGDGSAKGMVDLLARAGAVSQDRRRLTFEIPSTCEVRDGGTWILARPGEGGLQLNVRIAYPEYEVSEQVFQTELTPAGFEREIAPARTYGFAERLADMSARGKARGGLLENAVVFRGGKIVNPEGLRFPDEPARHKMLDLIGDLSLLGLRISGQVVARYSAHVHHHQLVRKLRELLE